MNRINLQRAILFICILGCIAIILYAWQYRGEQQKAAEIAALKVEQDAVIAHFQYMAQYEDTNFTRTPSIELIAVACATENGIMNEAVGAALVSRFKTGKVEVTSSFFKPTLITEGLFDDVFNGSGDMVRKLELAKYLDGVLAARQDVQYSTNSELNNIVTADMHLQIEALPVSGLVESQSWTLAAKGTGFNRADARMQAEERIIKQIGNNPTMSLGQSGVNH